MATTNSQPVIQAVQLPPDQPVVQPYVGAPVVQPYVGAPAVQPYAAARTAYQPVVQQPLVPRDRRGRMLEEEPYRGGPIPANARRVDRRRKGAFAWGGFFGSVGATAMGVSFAFLAVSSHVWCDDSYAANPSMRSYYGTYSTGVCYRNTDGGLVAGGLALLAGGVVFQAIAAGLMFYGRTSYPVLIYNHAGMVGRRARPMEFSVLPAAPGALAGATLSLTHF